MGVFDALRGRGTANQTTEVSDTSNTQNEKSVAAGEDQHPPSYDADTPPISSDGSHRGDMFDDAKELAHNPDTVTSDAELGQQKAEAAALVWSRPALVGIYAW